MATPATLELGGGRELPPLLFVTSRAGLTANVGAAAATQALAAVQTAGHQLFDTLPAGLLDSGTAVPLVRAEAARFPDLAGIVIVGGYDVVPPRRLDCLPPALRAAVDASQDADTFVVWSDDAYADLDGDGLPELPVSRIPDSSSAPLLFAGLGVGDQRRAQAGQGVRNVLRPFADAIYALLPGAVPMLISQPLTAATAPPLDADLVYLMLHGDYHNSTGFWGEQPPGGYPLAVNLSNIPAAGGRVVFTGCCWGALCAELPAAFLPSQSVPAARPASTSMALSLLQAGAVAFVGCTGSHYSPVDPPYEYYGGPLHRAFWQSLLGGAPPAKALLEAKKVYRAGFPHGLTGGASQAIEYKIVAEYSCLGLGW